MSSQIPFAKPSVGPAEGPFTILWPVGTSSLSRQSTTTASRLSSERPVVPSSLGFVDAPVALLSAILDAVRLSTGSTVVTAECALVKNVLS